MRGFRPDIEGLRAIAIGAVLLAHAGLPFARGGYVGVDVFFVISGFLIIGLLVRELEKTGTISLAGFYARRAKRLLPAAVTVLVAVTAITPLVLSPLRSEVVGGDVIASALYFVNWRFIGASTDYFGPTEALSPVQHYWSLSVEEQFYLVCPLLLLAATWWWRRSGRDVVPMLWVTLLATGAASLAYSVAYTAEIPGAAFFSPLTRGWEFALGGLISLLALRRVPVAAAAVAGAAGLAAIAVATFTYTDATPFPGTAALLPALGAGAIIAAGVVAPLRLLTLRPVRYVGRISYSLYLWHWPAVILADAAWGPLGVAAGAAVVAATIVPAAATYHWVEEPFRRSERLTLRPRRALAVGSGFSCAGVLAAILLIVVQPSFRTAAAADVEGAEALGHHAAVQRSATAVAPNPAEAGDDSGKLHADGCLVDPLDTRSGECAYADTSSETSVVLFGDSHAMQYFPALEPIAIERGWRLVGLTKAGCPPIDAPVWNPKLNRDYTECLEWRDDALRRIEEERPSLIVVSAAAYYSPAVDGEKIDDAEAKQEILTAGYVEMLERLRETGAEVVVVKDLPHAPYDVSDCVSESLGDLDECAFEIGEARGGYADRVDVAAAEAVEGVELLDVVPAICPDGVCRAVIGNAIVYRGTNHLTATFAATLAKRLERGLPHIGR